MNSNGDLTIRNDSGSGKLINLLLLTLIGLLLFVLLGVFNLFFAGDFGDYGHSDYMVLWLSGKGLTDGVDLYDPQAWEELHLKYAPGYSDNPIFIFPLPTALLFIPFSILPVRWSGAVWLLLNEILTILFFGWIIGKTKYKKNLIKVFLIALIVAVFLPVIITIKSGQYSLFMLIIVAAAFILLYKEEYWAAGAVTTLLILRPNPVIFFIPGLLIWALIHKRWKYLAGFLLAIVGLFLISELIRPGWIFIWFDFSIGNHGKIYSYGQISPTLEGMLADIGYALPKAIRDGIIYFVSMSLGIAGIGFSLKKELNLGYLFSILITISLCITPYAWNYDHVLLLFPLAYLILSQEMKTSRVRGMIWFFVIIIYIVLPYFLRYIAIIRKIDALSGLIPFAVLLLLMIISFHGKPLFMLDETSNSQTAG